MANQNLFVNLSVFVCFVYIVFLIAVQLPWNSFGNLSDLKYFRDGSFMFDSDRTTPPAFANETSSFAVLSSAGYSLSSPWVIATPTSRSLIAAGRVITRLRDNDLTASVTSRKKMMMGSSEKLHGKNDSNIFVNKKLGKTNSDFHKISTKEAVARYNCSKSLFVWCNKTGLVRQGTFFCKKCQCHMKVTRSVNVADVQNADIVLYYHMNEKPWKQLIRARPKGQPWVFFSRESPVRCQKCMPPESLGALFNISVTYHSESDVVVPYGTFTLFKDSEEKLLATNNTSTNPVNWAKDKTKSVLWVASNCFMAEWNRTQFVQHLAMYTPVDVYGKCGNLSCPIEEKVYCEKVFGKYKFYLALENSPCREYITEKVWRNSFERNLIPIVFGSERADYEKALPPNSFIFAEDFNSTKELAHFLEKIDRNDTLFNEYFKWRELGFITRWTRSLSFKTDNLCRIINRVKYYENRNEKSLARPISVEHWWLSSCRDEVSLKFTE